MSRSYVFGVFFIFISFPLLIIAGGISTDFDPGCIIDNSVNVLTGEHIESHVDLTINCAEPFSIVRSFSSSEQDIVSKYGVWHLSEDYIQVHCLNRPSDPSHFLDSSFIGEILLRESAGSVIDYHVPSAWWANNRPQACLLSPKHPQYWPNSYKDSIDGKTNRRNSRLYFRQPGFELVTGSGERRLYSCMGGVASNLLIYNTRYKGVCTRYDLVEEQRPNGNRILYCYGAQGLSEIRSVNREGEVLGWARFSYSEDQESATIAIETSDQQWARYDFEPKTISPHGKVPLPPYRLKKFSSSEEPAIHYSYTAPSCRLEETNGEKLPVSSGNSRSSNKVVEDAEGFLSEYITHPLNGGLLAIKHYPNRDSLAIEEKFTWASTPYNQQCDHAGCSQLQERSIEAGGKRWLRRRFEYDAFENPIKETIEGELTGRGWSAYSAEKRYSQDGLNLLLSVWDEAAETNYTYQPGTNLCTSEHLSSKTSNDHRRRFAEYDKSASLIREIQDDGIASDGADLTGVTERTIHIIHNRAEAPGLGLPEIIEERYLDLKTGDERLLRKVHLHYSEQNLITTKDIYDADGLLRYSLHTTYDSAGEVIEESDPLGQITRYVRDPFGNVIEVYSPQSETGLRAHFVYDKEGRLVSTEKADGAGNRVVVHQRYNRKDELICSIDSSGGETHYTYDGIGRMVGERTSCQMEIKREFDPFGHCTKESDGAGLLFQQESTIRGQPVKRTSPDGTTQRWEYSDRGELLKVVTGSGVAVRYTRDFLNRVTLEETLSPEGEVIKERRYQYVGSRLVSEIDPEGNKTCYEYDGAGRLIERSSGSHRSTYEWDALGRKVKEIAWAEEESLVTIWNYDLLDRVIEERREDLGGQVYQRTEWAYDRDGNQSLVATYDGEGTRIEMRAEYDFLGRVVKKIDGMGEVTTIHYEDGPTPKTTTVDPNGQITQMWTDRQGHPLKIEQLSPLGEVVSCVEFGYDCRGSKISETHTVFQLGNSSRQVRTEWQYDGCGRLVQLDEAVGTEKHRATRYAYNALGQLSAVTKPSGQMITYGYDLLGRLIKEEGSDFCHTYAYDRNDRLLSATDREGKTTMRSYAPTGELTQERLANGAVMSYQYDGRGRLSLLHAEKASVEYEYNAAFLKKVSRKSDNGRLAYSATYTKIDPRGMPLEIELPDSAGKLLYEWDRNGTCTRIQHKTTGWFTSDAYTEQIPQGGLDRVGQPLTISTTDPVGTLTQRYAYDDLYHVISEEGTAKHTYDYDSIYNRVACDDKPHEVDALNQLLCDAITHYTYDFDGRLIEKMRGSEAVRCRYDSLDRLIAIEGKEMELRFSYDPFHRRMSKELLTRQKDGTLLLKSKLRFLFVGNNEIGAMDAKGTLVEFRMLGIGHGAEIGAALALELDSKLFVPIHDRRGSVVVLLSRGWVAESYRYTAFGECQIFDSHACPLKSSAIGNPYRFCSKRCDEESGLLYFGARYYAPETGRWMTPDPKGYAAGPNLYAYCLGSPLALHDLYGLESGLVRPEPSWPTDPNPYWPPKSNNPHNRPHYNPGGPCPEFYQGSPDYGPVVEAIGKFLKGVGRFIKGRLDFGKRKRKRRRKQNMPPPPPPQEIRVVEQRPSPQLSPSESAVVLQANSNAGMDAIRGSSVAAVFFPGMLTTSYEAIKIAEFLTEYLGIPCYAVYNPTARFVADMISNSWLYVGGPCPAGRRGASAINATFAEVGPNGIVFSLAHSQGGMIMQQSLEKIPSDYRARLSVWTFGSPIRMGPSSEFCGVTNFANSNDPVSWLASFRPGRDGSIRHVTMLPPVKLIDHGFRGGCYEFYGLPGLKAQVERALQDIRNQEAVVGGER